MSILAYPPKRILILKPTSLGDIVHSLPFLSALSKKFPESEIDWLVHPRWQDVLSYHPAIHRLILFPRDKYLNIKFLFQWFKMWIKESRSDIIIDLQGLFRTGFLGYCSGSKQFIGLSDAREFSTLFYNRIVLVNRYEHAVNRYLNVLEYFGGYKVLLSDIDFTLPHGQVPKNFSTNPNYIVLHPYARGTGKSLSEDAIHGFLRAVYGRRVIIVGNGTPIKKLPSYVEDWSNHTTLLELISILRNSYFNISTDSGPMHLATALQPNKILGIHTRTNPWRVGPFFSESFVWKHGKIAKVGDMDASFLLPSSHPTPLDMEKIGKFILKNYDL